MKKQVLSFILAAVAALALCAPAMAYEGPEAAAYVSADSPETAAVKNGWVTSGGKRYYYQNGKKVTGLRTIGGKTYYFSAKDGHMMKGGWVTVNGKKYYLSAKDGHVLKNGWVTVNGKKYYLSAADGHMLKNSWLTVGGNKYYLDADGHMLKNGLIKVGGKLYYLNAKGVMLKSQMVTVNGKAYYIGADGVAVLQSSLFKKGVYMINGATGVLNNSKLTIFSKSGNTIEFSAWWHKQCALSITKARISGNRAAFSTYEATGYLAFTSANTVELTITNALNIIPEGEFEFKYYGTETDYQSAYNKEILLMNSSRSRWHKTNNTDMSLYFRPDGTVVCNNGRSSETIRYSVSGDVLYMGGDAYDLLAEASGITWMELKAHSSDPRRLEGEYQLYYY